MNNLYLSEAVVIKDHDFKEIIIESNGRERKAFQLEGLFQRANEPNKNNRVYSEDILRREASKLMSNVISREGGLIGEMEHPIVEANNPSSVNRAQQISYERGCIMIQDLKMSGRDIIGKCEILHEANTFGSTLLAMVSRGLKPGISSRAVGPKPTVTREGYMEVDPSIQFITWDIVSNPSVYNARLNAYVTESIEKEIAQSKVVKRNLWQVLEKIGN
jgi:hypothetical protein